MYYTCRYSFNVTSWILNFFKNFISYILIILEFNGTIDKKFISWINDIIAFL